MKLLGLVKHQDLIKKMKMMIREEEINREIRDETVSYLFLERGEW